MYGRLHADTCNVPQHLITGVMMHIKLTKAKPEFYLLGSKENGKVYFKILEALLYVKRIRPSPSILTAIMKLYSQAILSDTTLQGSNSRLLHFLRVRNHFPLTMPFWVASRNVRFSPWSRTDFLGTMSTNQFKFRHFELNHFAMYVNGRQVPPEGLTLDMSPRKLLLWDIEHYLMDPAFTIRIPDFR